MASTVLIFQIHQPMRLRKYSVFDTEPNYFDDTRNAEILRKVADKCYRPATRLILDLVRKHEGHFRVAFSISGTALEQFERFAPDLLDTFRELARTGHCEFLGETSHHSLASLFSPSEFTRQVEAHAQRIHALFHHWPTTFRNTELIYSNHIAELVAAIKDPHGKPRFSAMIAEGTDQHIDGRSHIARAVASDGTPLQGRDGPLKVLTRHYRLSDDIAFRFSNRAWSEWPLTPEKFAQWVAREEAGPCVLYMDYETLGEHQWAETGIFDFVAQLPEAIIAAAKLAGHRGAPFLTPAQAAPEAKPEAKPAAKPEGNAARDFNVPEPTSWADTERDVSAWQGNAMQRHALEQFAALEKPLLAMRAAAGRDAKAAAEADQAWRDWCNLSTSDHFYYMCTKYFADGMVHTYFNPYDSPYDSYINIMNVLDNLRTRIAADRLQRV
jgi:alpha-amylase